MSTFKDWFGIGLLGPYVATPNNLFGWLTTLGLTLPALVYATVGGGLGRLLAGGLFAFLFGFSYAIAEERGDGRPGAMGGAGALSPERPASVDETPLAA